MCATGDFDQAELKIIEFSRQHLGRLKQYPEAFICLLQALFVVQRFDLVAVMLKDRYDFVGDLEIGAEEGRESPACVRWSISVPNAHQFILILRALQDDHATHRILMLHWAFSMFANLRPCRNGKQALSSSTSLTSGFGQVSPIVTTALTISWFLT